jgi:hypothetical protein
MVLDSRSSKPFFNDRLERQASALGLRIPQSSVFTSRAKGFVMVHEADNDIQSVR